MKMQEALSIEDAAQSLIEPQSDDQVEQEAGADVSEVETDEPELEADEAELSDEQPADEVEDEGEEVEATGTDDVDDDDDPILEIQTKYGVEEVKFSELTDGYMRNKDYTQKSQENAAARKEIDAERVAVKQQKSELQNVLATLATEQHQEPDWSKVDPAEYPRLRQEWDTSQAKKQQAADLYRQLQQQHHAEQMQQAQAALLEYNPGWQDPAAWNSAWTDMVGVAETFGFSNDEISGIVDPRMIRILHEFGALKKGSAKQKQNVAKVAKRVAKAAKRPVPSAKPAQQQGEAKRVRHHMDRLKKSGSIEDAAQAILMKGS